LYLPGLAINTPATQYHPIPLMQLITYTGARWQNLGGFFAA
jgi:hypothetical protein